MSRMLCIGRTLSPLALAVAALAVGCEDKTKSEPAPAPAPSGSASPFALTTAHATAISPALLLIDAGRAATDASASAAATDGGGADAGAAHMANCPSSVSGASVALKDVEGGIEISITGKDESTAKDIKDRMAKLVASDKNEAAAGVKHDHGGSGGGAYGRCTIVMRNTKLETADIKEGVKATVKAKDKSEIDWLRRETRERDKEAKLPAADGAGTHRMAHCPSAVTGAKTTIKDSKEGVIVTVTGAGDAVKDIRDRAKHTKEMAKLPAVPKVEHTSDGKGGGGVGRCPVVVEGDTTVEVKDVENGSEITVKAKKDVAALQKETKLRAQNFGAK